VAAEPTLIHTNADLFALEAAVGCATTADMYCYR
jgi:hypothetical protein